MMYRGTEPEDPNDRGGCLTAWLIGLFANIVFVGIIAQLFGESSTEESIPAMNPSLVVIFRAAVPNWAVLALSILYVFQIICLLAIWNWKKWAVYAITASAVIEVVIILGVGGRPVHRVLFLLVPYAILIALIRPKWHLFNKISENATEGVVPDSS